MNDNFGRRIKYLRLSVTDLCQLRCVYCMPERGVEKLEHGGILSVEECVEMARACAELGVTKVRLTGGEPLVRRGIIDICRGIAEIPEIEELCLTTNALLLEKYAQQLRGAGVTRLNISLDTLDAEKYRRVTRVGSLDDVFRGLDAADDAGFEKTKINCVLMGGINDDEIADMVALTKNRDIQVRFIELMPIGECAAWDRARFIPGETVLRAVPELAPAGESGVAQVYRVPGYAGTVGLIDPISHKFCASCDRIRITADGKLKPCLHSSEEIPLRGKHGAELVSAIGSAILAKPQGHLMEGGGSSSSQRGMSRIGG